MSVTHPELVKALVKSPKAIMESASEFSTDIWHGATGVAGECGELLECLSAEDLDRDNLIEELGDLEFYEEQLRQRTGLTRDPTVDGAVATMLDQNPPLLSMDLRSVGMNQAVAATIAGLQILDTVKKCSVYNKELDIKLLSAQLEQLDIAQGIIRSVFGIDRETEVLPGNIKKLSKRYEGLQYSDAAAHARADKEEELVVKRNYFGQQDVDVQG